MRTVGIAGAWIVGLGVAAFLTVGILSLVGAAQTRREFKAEEDALVTAARTMPVLPPPDRVRIRALPTPVRANADALLAKRQPAVNLMRVEQTGAIRTGPDRPWMPFKAEQVYSINPPGFLWLAEARIAPGISLWARDKYVSGGGNMRLRWLGLFTLADAIGPELDQGAALRYWSEILVFPYAAFGPGVMWRPLDGRKAHVAFTDGGLTVEADVEFDDRGDFSAFHADRYQERNGKYVLLPWTGLARDWKVVDGFRIPTHWEAVWHQPEGDFTYVRIDILSVRAG